MWLSSFTPPPFLLLQTEYDVHFLMFKQLALPVPASLLVCDCGLVVTLLERIKVFDMQVNLKEMYHVSDIREVSSKRTDSTVSLYT